MNYPLEYRKLTSDDLSRGRRVELYNPYDERYDTLFVVEVEDEEHVRVSPNRPEAHVMPGDIGVSFTVEIKKLAKDWA